MAEPFLADGATSRRAFFKRAGGGLAALSLATARSTTVVLEEL